MLRYVPFCVNPFWGLWLQSQYDVVKKSLCSHEGNAGQSLADLWENVRSGEREPPTRSLRILKEGF
jgi:hypothetical protein